MRLTSAVAFMFLILIFFICFYYMLYMMWYALQVIRPPEEGPLCGVCQSVRESVKRIFVFTAVMLLLAFIVSLIVLWIEQRLWENSRCCK